MRNKTQAASLVHKIVLKFHLAKFVFSISKINTGLIVKTSVMGFVDKQVGVMEK